MFKHLVMLTLTPPHHWCEQHPARIDGQRQHLIDHLRNRLRLEDFGVIGTARLADAGKQQPQIIVDLGDGADRRTWIVRGRFLLDGNRWRQTFDVIDVGLFHDRQKLPRIGRQRFDVATLAFGVDGVKGQRGLAGAGQAGDHDQPVARQIEIDILEVVRACAAQMNRIHGLS